MIRCRASGPVLLHRPRSLDLQTCSRRTRLCIGGVRSVVAPSESETPPSDETVPRVMAGAGLHSCGISTQCFACLHVDSQEFAPVLPLDYPVLCFICDAHSSHSTHAAASHACASPIKKPTLRYIWPQPQPSTGTHTNTHPPTHPHTHSHSHSHTHSLSHHPLTLTLTHSPTHPLTHSLHTFTHRISGWRGQIRDGWLSGSETARARVPATPLANGVARGPVACPAITWIFCLVLFGRWGQETRC